LVDLFTGKLWNWASIPCFNFSLVRNRIRGKHL
jgi:hypothetical protein